MGTYNRVKDVLHKTKKIQKKVQMMSASFSQKGEYRLTNANLESIALFYEEYLYHIFYLLVYTSYILLHRLLSPHWCCLLCNVLDNMSMYNLKFWEIMLCIMHLLLLNMCVYIIE